MTLFVLSRRRFPAKEKIRILLEGIRTKISVVELCRRSPSGREAAQAATRPGPQGRTPSEGYRSEGISLLANTCRRAASLARPEPATTTLSPTATFPLATVPLKPRKSASGRLTH